MAQSDTIGVLLCNMGGPDRLEDVAPFLKNLFSDRDLIRLGPSWLQKPLAHLIARRRAPKSKKIYELIGGGSPQKRITLKQAKALEARLNTEGNFTVGICMRYWSPSSDESVAELLEKKVRGIIAVSLYPHYSKATGGSSLKDLRQAVLRQAPDIPYAEVMSWPDHPQYIAALVQHIREGMAHFGTEPVSLVYSAHSLPVSFIEAGDPYVSELQRTISTIETETGIVGQLCYQSRSGPVAWLSPSTEEMIHELARQKSRNLLVVPISFVSDHIETLYEIDILYREQARALGMELRSIASLNTSPLFIDSLKDLVSSKLPALTPLRKTVS